MSNEEAGDEEVGLLHVATLRAPGALSLVKLPQGWEPHSAQCEYREGFYACWDTARHSSSSIFALLEPQEVARADAWSTREWVENLGYPRHILDSSSEELWFCSKCCRWCGVSKCCGVVAPAKGAKRKRLTCLMLAPLRPVALSLRIFPARVLIEADVRATVRDVAGAAYWHPDSCETTAWLLPRDPTVPWRVVEDAVYSREHFHQPDMNAAALEEQVPAVDTADHRPAQAGCLAWALAREAGERPWLTKRRFLATTKPFANVAVAVEVQLRYAARGGVLAMSTGTGKTLVALSLIAASVGQAPLPPAGPLLHRLPTTLVLATPCNVAQASWEKEAQRSLPTAGLRVLTVTEQRQLRGLSLRTLESTDVLVVPHTALDWQCFQQEMRDPPNGSERCRHTRKCKHFQETRGKALANELARRPPVASARMLAEVTLLGVAWERVIFDDLLGCQIPPLGRAIATHIVAPRRWVLASEPQLGLRGQQSACDLLQVAVLEEMGERHRFLKECFCGGTWDTSGVRVTHLTYRVRLSGLERICYETEYARACDENITNCVRKCSHWHDTSADGVLTLQQACEESLHALEELYVTRKQALDSIESVVGAPYLQGSCERKKEELSRLESQRKYVAKVFASLENPDSTCPVCMEPLGAEETSTITACGHIFHPDCLEVSPDAACPICRAPLCLFSEGVPLLRPLQFRSVRQQGTSSKIQALLSYLKSHVAAWKPRGSLGKVLVLVQWRELRDRIEAAFGAERFPFVVHKQGSTLQVQRALAAFSSEALDSPVILLASFERRLGLDIQAVASHLVFVHPCVATAGLRPEQTEAHAHGCVIRPGQKRPVCVVRFVAKDTLEEQLLTVQPHSEHIVRDV